MNKTRYERVSSLPRDLLSESDSASKRSFNFGGNGGDFISQRQLCPSISGMAQVNLINDLFPTRTMGVCVFSHSRIPPDVFEMASAGRPSTRVLLSLRVTRSLLVDNVSRERTGQEAGEQKAYCSCARHISQLTRRLTRSITFEILGLCAVWHNLKRCGMTNARSMCRVHSCDAEVRSVCIHINGGG